MKSVVSTAAVTAILTTALPDHSVGFSQNSHAFLSQSSLGVSSSWHRSKGNRLVNASKASLLSSITSDETLETTINNKDDASSDLEDDSSDYVKSSGNIWQISNEKQHAAFLADNQDKIVILKFYAPWCRSCKGLEPKYRQIVNDDKYSNLPLEFAELNVQDNREFVKSVGVLALPSVLIYCGTEGLIENFTCGPRKTPFLKKKLITIINSRVDPVTRELLQSADTTAIAEAAPCRETTISKVDETKVGEIIISEDRLAILRSSVPSFHDPFATSSNYLDAALNNPLGPANYFSERGLTTEVPRAAGMKATETNTVFRFQTKPRTRTKRTVVKPLKACD